MHKTDRGFTAGNVHEKQLYPIPASQPPLRVHKAEQHRQPNSSLPSRQEKHAALLSFRRSHPKSAPPHSCVQTCPLPLPEGIYTGKFPLRQTGRGRSPLEMAPLSFLKRPEGVNHISGLWGRQGLNAHQVSSGWETAVCLHSPYPRFTALLRLSLDSQEFLLLYLLRDRPACGRAPLCGPDLPPERPGTLGPEQAACAARPHPAPFAALHFNY